MNTGNVNQLGRNLQVNIASFICNIIVGLWLIPYLIQNIGVAAYGLVPLAMVFTEYISVITQSFNSAVSRFLTVELSSEKNDEAIVVFNSSLALILLLCLPQIVAAVFIIANIQEFVKIPSPLINDTIYLFIFTFAAFVISIIGSVFNVSLFSKNRLDLIRFNDIGVLFVRVLFTVLFFYIYEASLFYVGFAIFIASIFSLGLSIFQWKKLTPEINIDFRKVEFARLKPIAGMACWVIINTVGYLLFIRIDIYIVNLFLGAEAGGEYAAVLQWSQLLRTTAGVFSGVITPLALIYYAQGETQKLIQMMCLAVKIMGIVLALPIALLCAFSDSILAVWLGENFRSLGGLMALQLCTSVINLGVLPLFSINTAMNLVKIPAITTLVMGLLNFVLAIFFLKELEWGYYGVAIAGIIVLTMKNAIFTPWYSAYVLNLDRLTFFRPLLNGFIAFCILYIVSSAIHSFLQFASLASVILTLTSLMLAFALPLAWGGLSVEERTLVANLAPGKFRQGCRKLLLVSR